VLDEHHSFANGQAMAVSGNTAAIIVSSRLSRHFEVDGSKCCHLGEFKGLSISNPFAKAPDNSGAGKCC